MYNLRSSKTNRSCVSVRGIRYAVCLILIALVGIAALHAVSGAAPTPTADADKVNIHGTVFTWREGSSYPQDGVSIEVERDGRQIWGGESRDGGKFSFDIADGPPVVIVFTRTGYAEGRVICGVADSGDQSINVALLSYQDARTRWGDVSTKYFTFPGL